MNTLQRAIREAKRIHHELLQMDHWKKTNLAGACGLASILLSIALNDVTILRYASLDWWIGEHVWAEVNGVIIDITASQFQRHVPKLKREVLVTREPLAFHDPVQREGMGAYLLVVNGNWYSDRDHPEWSKISEYWLP